MVKHKGKEFSCEMQDRIVIDPLPLKAVRDKPIFHYSFSTKALACRHKFTSCLCIYVD